MAEVTEELKTEIVEYFQKKNKMMTHKDVAKGVGTDNRTAKKALTELINTGTLEFTSYGGATFIKLPDE